MIKQNHAMLKYKINRTALLHCFCILILILVISPISYAEAPAQDYKFFDAEGFEVTFPEVSTIYTLKKPGPWSKEASWHIPEVKSRFRKEGLENIRIVELRFPHHPVDSKTDYISEIYLKDKDGLLVGYTFLQEDAPLYVKFKINGVINFIQIYVFCNQHGVWRSDVSL